MTAFAVSLAVTSVAAAPLPYVFVQADGGPPGTWAAVLPLSGSSATPSPLLLSPGVPQYVALPEDSPALVCVGADGCATTCRRIDQELEHFALTDGQAVRGSCRIGRVPAVDATVYFRPARVESRRPISIPVARTSAGLVSATKTDAGGVYRAVLAPGEYTIEVHFANGRIHESAAISVPQKPANSIFDLPAVFLEPGIPIHVQVRDSAGAPLPDAGVGMSQREGQDVVVSVEGRTDAHGTIALEGLRPDLPVAVTCSATGFARREERLDGPPSTYTCVLDRLGSIRGTVVDTAGNPVNDAVISMIGQRHRSTPSRDGTFVMRHVNPGQDSVHIAAAGFGTVSRAVEIEAGRELDLGTIALREGDAIRGRVVDAENDTPLHGALVTLTEPPGGDAGRTDAEGRFVIKGDLDHRTVAEISATGYATQTIRVARDLMPSDGLLVRLPRPGGLEVNVWDDSTDAPCAGCTVLASNDVTVLSTTTDTAGAARFEALSPGEYHVSREYVRAGQRVVSISGGGTNRVALVRSREITRVDLGTRGRRVRVSVTPQPTPEWRLSAVGSAGVVTSERDETGGFLLRVRHGESYRLQLNDSTRGAQVGVIPADDQRTFLSLAVGAAAVRGTLVQRSQPVVGAHVSVNAPDGSLKGWAFTRVDGSFEIPHLTAGMYALHAAGLVRRSVTVSAMETADVGVLSLP